MKKYGKPPCKFKISITGSQYFALIDQYQEDQIKAMHYIYFDTSCEINEAQLLNRRMRLRVRVKDGKYSLELKIKTQATQEFKEKISEKDLANLFQGILPDGEIKKILEDVDGRLLNVKTSNTTRAKKNFQGGLLVLDRTICRGKTYFQIEFRSYTHQAKVVSGLKKRLNIIKKAAIITKLMFVWCA